MDTLTGHLALTADLLAVTDEHVVWRRLKKLPLLLPLPFIAILLSVGMYSISELRMFQYYINSFVVLVMCALWVRWTWQFQFWQAFAATCMADIFQVAGATLSSMLPLSFATAIGLHLGINIVVSLLVVVMVMLMTVLIVYLAKRFDAAPKIQAQQNVIIQQQLYEQNLEMTHREVRAFRHDYKNLLAGLFQQAKAGELEGLRHALFELDAGFDLRLGRKIQASTQIGNLQIPEVRSLLLSKLAVMQEMGIEYRLEVLYPFVAVDMDTWDFVRCLGILIDNAIEAALDTEQPWVEIVLLAQDGRTFLRISNPYTNIIEPGRIWDDGWSTKGTGRASYQRILKNHPNISPCTNWDNGVFIQALTVEGKT